MFYLLYRLEPGCSHILAVMKSSKPLTAECMCWRDGYMA